MKIGVFDSGIGGLSVANALEIALPEHEIIFANDQEHMPYGSRSADELLRLVTPIFQQLVDKGCQAIVVACNTVSATIIDELRLLFTVELIAMVPMVKPAAELTKTGVIAVCATPTTLASKRYQQLKDTYAKNIRVIEPDCSDWAYMIEHNQIQEEQVRQRIEAACQEGADVIVLGCTHYHWIEDQIKILTRGRAEVLQPEAAIILQVKRVLHLV